MASYRRRKKSSKAQKLSATRPAMEKSKSLPNIRQEVDWPGQIEDKYVEEVKNRLNVIEQAAVSDEMVRAFLAAHDCKARHAVEALKKCVEWRKGRQMFWNNYRSTNERYQFLSQIRKVGRGIASTFGHTKNGRLVFYEKIGENFNMSLFKEFTQSEFIDHVIVWCENLLNFALANAGKPTHLIHEIPFYEDELNGDGANNDDEKGNKSQNAKPMPITPEFNGGGDDGFPDTDNMRKDVDGNSDDDGDYKSKFDKFEIKSNGCNFTDVVGIIDWKGCNVDMFIENKLLLLGAEELLSTYYPHLINRLYHINMPLNFEKIETALKSSVSAQILKKSIFLESQDTKQKRIDYMKKHGKRSLRARRSSNKRGKKKNGTSDEKEVVEQTDLDALDEWSRSELLEVISSNYLGKEYGGDIEMDAIYTYVDPIYRHLVGVSSEPDPSGYEEFMSEEAEAMKSWKSHPLRSLERHTDRHQVKRGEHYIWQYTAEYDRKLIFGVTFESPGFRGKTIKVIVREETEQICGYCPMFGDFIVLKDGTLVFQFRNIKGGKRLNLQYKITKKTFPKSFVNKHLPDYHAEERFIQSKTLNPGGKSLRGKGMKTSSQYSGSTALSTSPPPDLSSLRVNNKSEKRMKSISPDFNSTEKSAESQREKIRKSKSYKPKKSKKKVVKKKKSSKVRAKTPEPPNTPIAED